MKLMQMPFQLFATLRHVSVLVFTFTFYDKI